jgi:5-formyltetrahydrofolate cyclo-ligase
MDNIRALKVALRKEAEARRRDQPDKADLSAAICGRFAALAEYQRAATVMLYVGVRNEVRTQALMLASLAAAKRVVVPYCAEGELQLFHLQDPSELAAGHFGIPEPQPALRTDPARRVDARELDVVMVPGVAFDRQGGRLGHGKGYYDRLLRNVRRDALLAAAAFECQLFPEIPMSEHDVFMDKVITEKGIYEGRGR